MINSFVLRCICWYTFWRMSRRILDISVRALSSLSARSISRDRSVKTRSRSARSFGLILGRARSIFINDLSILRRYGWSIVAFISSISTSSSDMLSFCATTLTLYSDNSDDAYAPCAKDKQNTLRKNKRGLGEKWNMLYREYRLYLDKEDAQKIEKIKSFVWILCEVIPEMQE